MAKEHIAMNKQVFGRGLFFWLGLSLALGLTATLAEAQQRITSDVKGTFGARLTYKEQQAVSLATGRILIHVNHARTHVRHKRPKEAQDHVEKALTLAKIVEATVPEQRIESTIKAGNLVYQNNETVKPMVVPVYPELDETGSLLIPVKRAKREAGSATDSSSGQSDGQLQYTTVLLDVGEARYYLEDAAAALKNSELVSADKALLAIQEEVEFDFDEMSLPLVKARSHLVDASRKAANKEFQAAKEALHKAAGAVETYTAQVGESMSSTARGLADEINHLAIKIDEKKDRAVETIQGFWGRVRDLM
jgi:hypothetical protein